jgi:hypothetical protein
MSTVIKTWQIVDSALKPLQPEDMSQQGRLESDLEQWIMSNPEIIGENISIIGNQVETDYGDRIDLLGIDSSGNTVIIELKRGSLPPRTVLAQAIDYATNVAKWKDSSKLDDVCLKHKKKKLREFFNEEFEPDQDIALNATQRIILVGFAIEAQLEEMIEWLSHSYRVDINAIILSYIKTQEGNELLVKTSILDETAQENPENHFRLEYWTGFLKYLQGKNSILESIKPRPWNYLSANLGKPFARLGSLIYVGMKKIGVRLYITGPNAESYFKQLREEKEAIDTQIKNEMDGRLTWRDRSKGTKSIILFKDVADFEDTGSWPDQYRWLHEGLEAFNKIFAGKIANLEDVEEPDENETTT